MSALGAPLIAPAEMALRWFVNHRTTKRLAEMQQVDEMLLARTCAF